MARFVIICVVLVTIAVYGFLEVDSGNLALNRNLVVGNQPGPYDFLLYSTRVFRAPTPNAIVSADAVYRGYRVNITYISAVEQIAQNSTVVLSYGGLGRSNATLAFTSARGRGFTYLVNIYGRNI